MVSIDDCNQNVPRTTEKIILLIPPRSVIANAIRVPNVATDIVYIPSVYKHEGI